MKSCRKTIGIAAALLSIAVICVTFFQVTSAKASDKLVIRLAHNQAAGSEIADSIALISDIVAEDASMNMEVQIYPSGVLGTEKDIIEMVKAGICLLYTSIEGEVVPNVRIKEDQNTHTGFAMPEFPGYTGPASDQCWLIKVKAVTHRVHPIMQTCIGPSEEHVSMAGIPTEASIYGMVEKAMPGRLQNVYCCSAGGGKYMAVLQFKKSVASDEGRQRQAALLAFSAFSELKHIFLVDEDVDCFDMNDVLWAMNTRFQGDVDTITIPGVRCHPLDPSNDPAFSPSIRDHGIACKTIFDCTVPFDQKDRFVRARFMELDPSEWVKQKNEGKIS